MENKEQILCIDDSYEALKWRIRIINMARSNLVISVFDFIGDNSGMDIMSAILDAQSRGVRIKILIDGLNGFRHLSSCRHFWYLASLPGIEVRFYNPLKKFPFYKINYRLHDKYIIADDDIYLLGGRNICDVSLGKYIDRVNLDRDILVRSANDDAAPSLFVLKKYFEEIWNLSSSRNVQNPYNDDFKEEAAQLRNRYDELPKSMLTESINELFENMITVSGISLLHNPVQADKKAPVLWKILCTKMAMGREIFIQSPYMICNNRMYRDLKNICSLASYVKVITNSPETGANPWGCSDYLNQKDNILKTGVEIYEYFGDQSMHTKTILIDRDISIVGSFNMDMRSAYLDTELMLLIHSPELNKQLRDVMEEFISRSRHLLPNGSEQTGTNYRAIPMSQKKKYVYSFLRVLCTVGYPGRKFL